MKMTDIFLSNANLNKYYNQPGHKIIVEHGNSGHEEAIKSGHNEMLKSWLLHQFLSNQLDHLRLC